MNKHFNTSGKYKSVSELPKVKEIKRSILVFKLCGWLLGNRDVKKEVKNLQAELDDLIDVVNQFYRILGSRNWAFSEMFNLEKLRTVVAQPTAEAAERKLIEYFKDPETLSGLIISLHHFSAMHPRIPLLEKAAKDYLEGRYYSSVFVTVSVMDGFVNDAFKYKKRRGLHARKAEEFYDESCFSTVWEGLPSIHQVFTKSIHARIDKPIYDVYRHGIMHGMAVNFDNDVVATKAWCMLFAVADWMNEQNERQKKLETQFDNALGDWKKVVLQSISNARNNKRLKEWQKHHINFDFMNTYDNEILESCVGYFEAWKAGNYGELASYVPYTANTTLKALAGEVRKLYEPYPLEGYEICEISRPAAAIADVVVNLKTASRSQVTTLRFVRFKGEIVAAEWEPGEWKVMRYGIDPFINMDEAVHRS